MQFLNKTGGDGKQWSLNPSPFLAPWPSHPPAIETPPRPVLAGPLISWPRNASCSWIPPRASCASLPPRWWATTRCRLSLCPCTSPLSCSLQPLLKLLLLSLRPSLLPIYLTRFTFAASRKSDFWTCVCVFTFISSAFASVRNELQLQVPVCNLVVITTAIPLLLLPLYSFLAVSEMLNHSDTCAVSSVCNAVGLLILLKLCSVFIFLQQLMTKREWVMYTCTCSPMFSIDVVASARDDPCICW